MMPHDEDPVILILHGGDLLKMNFHLSTSRRWKYFKNPSKSILKFSPTSKLKIEREALFVCKNTIERFFFKLSIVTESI